MILIPNVPWPKKNVWKRECTLWLPDSYLFVCLFVLFFLELNEHFLKNFIAVPKSSSHSIAIFLNYSLFLTTHFQFIYPMFTHYVFYVLMELPCHCICINVVTDNLSWLASYYSAK